MVWVDAREVMQVQAFGLRERLARSCATQQNSSLALYESGRLRLPALLDG